jgi:hypothetical protein
MDASMFEKMRVKFPCAVTVLYAPPDYPPLMELNVSGKEQADLVHLFVESHEQFTERFPQAAEACKKDGALWISYPRSKGKITYDINRDSLWSLLLAEGFHPVSQISLDGKWSAVRAKRNETGAVYSFPDNVKKEHNGAVSLKIR